ncbi:MAG: tRNA (guanosine(46)-N7)-methyltransferase TrmB [Beijerinckiaceae bacterium]
MTDTSDPSAPIRTTGRFFGRSKGKTLRAQQSAIFADVMPRLRIPAGTDPLVPKDLFSFEPKSIRLEIGFGGGEHLLKRAQEFPETGFIGCEPFVNGMAKLLRDVDQLGLRNIRVFDNDATYLLERLPTGGVDAIDLLYPDPWPKRKQRKRRFISDETLAMFARVLRPGGTFCFASDIDDYVGWTLTRVLESKDWIWPATGPDEWTKPYPGWVTTRYETKAFEAGRTPAYLTFTRNA